MTPFGLHIRRLREQRGITQKEMAIGIGVTPAYLSALEHGHRGTASYALIQRIAGYFNIIWDDAERLQNIAALSDPKTVVDTRHLSAKATELANTLEQNIEKLDEQQLDGLIEQIVNLTETLQSQ